MITLNLLDEQVPVEAVALLHRASKGLKPEQRQAAIDALMRNSNGIVSGDNLTKRERLAKQDAIRLEKAQEQSRKQQAEEQARIESLVAKSKVWFNSKVDKLVDEVQEGKVPLKFFRNRFLDILRKHLITSVASTVGNINKVSASDLRRVDVELRRQGEYLDRWVRQLEKSGVENMSATQVKQRGALYGEVGTRISQQTIDKRLYKEFPDLPLYPKEGTLCKNKCKCRWEWNIKDIKKGDADVWWRLADVEHCQTCLDRAQAFRPLRIRNFEFVNLPTDIGALSS